MIFVIYRGGFGEGESTVGFDAQQRSAEAGDEGADPRRYHGNEKRD